MREHLVGIGWTFVTPKFNGYKQFFWVNKARYPLAAIAFARRQIDALDGIPIFEFDEVHERFGKEGFRLLCTTINKEVLASAERYFSATGAKIEALPDFLAHESANGLDAAVSPFEAIPFSRMKEDRPPRGIVSRRLYSHESYQLYSALLKAFGEYRWDAFYDLASSKTDDAFLTNALDRRFANGVFNFVLLGPDAMLPADVLLAIAPMHHTGSVSLIVTDETHLGARAGFYRLILRDRLVVGGAPSGILCVVAAKVAELAMWVEKNHAQARTAEIVVRLPGSIYDLHDLVQMLDANSMPHRIVLDQISVDSSKLYAELVPVD